MANSKEMTYEPRAGENFDYSAKEAIRLAAANDATVQFSFNGVSLKAEATTDPADLKKAFFKAMEDESKAYANSPQAKADAAREAAEVKNTQATLDKLASSLDGALAGGLTETIKWVKDYANNADDNRVNNHRQEVLGKLKAAGFKANEYTGDKFVKGNKEILGRYILGQVVSNMEGGMPPHPIASKFAQDYLDMPDKGTRAPQTASFKKNP